MFYHLEKKQHAMGLKQKNNNKTTEELHDKCLTSSVRRVTTRPVLTSSTRAMNMERHMSYFHSSEQTVFLKPCENHISLWKMHSRVLLGNSGYKPMLFRAIPQVASHRYNIVQREAYDWIPSYWSLGLPFSCSHPLSVSGLRNIWTI